MSYRKDRADFLKNAALAGVDAKVAKRLLTLANRHQLICLMSVNVNVGNKFDAEERQLEKAIGACMGPGFEKIVIDGDPRGATVKVVFVTHVRNCMGVKDGYCVPTNITNDDAEIAAGNDPMSWE